MDRLRVWERGGHVNVDAVVHLPKVEDQANSYFQQIYNHPPASNMSIEQVLTMLKRFKDSSSKMEKVGKFCWVQNDGSVVLRP